MCLLSAVREDEPQLGAAEERKQVSGSVQVLAHTFHLMYDWLSIRHRWVNSQTPSCMPERDVTPLSYGEPDQG